MKQMKLKNEKKKIKQKDLNMKQENAYMIFVNVKQ